MGEERGLVFFSPNVLLFHLMLVQEPRWRALSRRHQRLASEQRRLVYKERTICPIESGRGENYNNPWVCPGLLLYQSFLVSDVYFFVCPSFLTSILLIFFLTSFQSYSHLSLHPFIFTSIHLYIHPFFVSFILFSNYCHILPYFHSFLPPFILSPNNFFVP